VLSTPPAAYGSMIAPPPTGDVRALDGYLGVVLGGALNLGASDARDWAEIRHFAEQADRLFVTAQQVVPA